MLSECLERINWEEFGAVIKYVQKEIENGLDLQICESYLKILKKENRKLFFWAGTKIPTGTKKVK